MARLFTPKIANYYEDYYKLKGVNFIKGTVLSSFDFDSNGKVIIFIIFMYYYCEKVKLGQTCIFFPNFQLGKLVLLNDYVTFEPGLSGSCTLVGGKISLVHQTYIKQVVIKATDFLEKMSKR